MTEAPLTDRQQRELDYHREHAAEHGDAGPISLDVVTQDKSRRWWNHYWSFYGQLRNAGLEGKKVLVPGCGFGEDVALLAKIGADAHGFDLSPDSVKIALEKMEKSGVSADIKTGTCEAMPYDDDMFDAVVFVDILHHVDIPVTMKECMRVLKSDGQIIGDELYTHSFLQKNIRESWFVSKLIYPRMQKFIYGTDKPYITEDEHKIDEDEFKIVEDEMKNSKLRYFNIISGRLFPGHWRWAAQLDRIICALLGH